MAYLESAVVIIPENEDRDEYVESSKRRGVVNLYSPSSGYIQNVRISMGAALNIEYPKSHKEFGSEVLYTRIHGSDSYVVVDVLKPDDSPNFDSEGVYRLGHGDAAVMVDSKTGSMASVSKKSINRRIGEGALDELASDGDIKRQSKNYKISVIESMIIEAIRSSDVGIEFNLTPDGVTVSDRSGNKFIIGEKKISIVGSNSVVAGNGEEVAILGKVTKSFLDDFISAVSSITVATSLGTMPILNKVQVEALKRRTSELLSEYFKIQ